MYYKYVTTFCLSLIMIGLLTFSGIRQVYLPYVAAMQPPPTPTLFPATAIVTKLDGTDDGHCDPSDCSLQEAVNSLTNGGDVTFAEGIRGEIDLDRTLAIRQGIRITGPGPTAADLILRPDNIVNEYQLFHVYPNGNLTIRLLTLTAPTDGGYAGGIFNEQGNVTIIDSMIQDTPDSAIQSFHGVITISGSTFYHNMGTIGGAIWNFQGVLYVKNSTFFANKATSGGAIGNDGGIAIIEYSTFADNWATSSDNIYNTGHLTISNSILKQRTGESAFFTDCSSGVALVDLGHNIQFPNKQCGDSILVADPLLSFNLADNGGPTPTLALMEGSPAINAGDTKVCEEQIGFLDQRGMTRSDGKCDIGAYEK